MRRTTSSSVGYGDFNAGRLRAVRAMHCIGVDALSKVGTNRSGRRFPGIRRAHQIAIFNNRILAFEHLNDDRT